MSKKSQPNADLFEQIVDNYNGLKYTLLDTQTFDPNHFGFPQVYYKIMETDQTRVNAFVKAFEQYNNMKDAVVCEIGVWTLALTKHYLPFVKKAYLIENNPDLKEFVTQQIQESGYADKIELIFADATTVQLPENVDYIIWELMSIFCANEFQVQIFKHMRQFLKPGGKLIPEKILNIASLSNAAFENGHKHYPINFTRHLPELLSLPIVVDTIDPYTAQETHRTIQSSFVPLLNGVANSVYMQSFVQISSQSNFTGTDSLMPPTVCILEKAVDVKAGNQVNLKANFSYGTSLNEAVFSI